LRRAIFPLWSLSSAEAFTPGSGAVSGVCRFCARPFSTCPPPGSSTFFSIFTSARWFFFYSYCGLVFSFIQVPKGPGYVLTVDSRFLLFAFFFFFFLCSLSFLPCWATSQRVVTDVTLILWINHLNPQHHLLRSKLPSVSFFYKDLFSHGDTQCGSRPRPTKASFCELRFLGASSRSLLFPLARLRILPPLGPRHGLVNPCVLSQSPMPASPTILCFPPWETRLFRTPNARVNPPFTTNFFFPRAFFLYRSGAQP